MARGSAVVVTVAPSTSGRRRATSVARWNVRRWTARRRRDLLRPEQRRKVSAVGDVVIAKRGRRGRDCSGTDVRHGHRAIERVRAVHRGIIVVRRINVRHDGRVVRVRPVRRHRTGRQGRHVGGTECEWRRRRGNHRGWSRLRTTVRGSSTVGRSGWYHDLFLLLDGVRRVLGHRHRRAITRCVSTTRVDHEVLTERVTRIRHGSTELWRRSDALALTCEGRLCGCVQGFTKLSVVAGCTRLIAE